MKDVKSYYDSTSEYEYNRLGQDRPLHYQLEFERTVEQLANYLPDSGHILDAGGGSGRYSEWLAENGYTVTLCDLSQGQLSKANNVLQNHTNVTLCQGSISQLPLQEKQFDGILCTGGPLSHLIDKSERISAIQEFKRVAKENSTVFISVMGLVNALRTIATGVPEFDQTSLLPEFAEDGLYTHKRANNSPIQDEDAEFTECKFFRADEFKTFLQNQGVLVNDLIGLESITYGTSNELTSRQETAIREAVSALGNDSTIVDLSPHILAVGTLNRK